MSATSYRQKYRVLLAEDDEINQQIVMAFLASAPHIELTVVGDGRSALEAALGSKYDLMLFDHNMPHITGDRVIRYLRSGNSSNAATPVVRFTADADRAEVKSRDGLIDAVLPKPLKAETFLTTIESILRRD
ncbi:response regulator [Rhodobacteraceae bacterium HSP-20]|uniref:Response regulator n=1 Tax=Paragemmobacter amnigenus TaxID=2852097 RepID=A0ABS6J2D1_9RHOB|nr:response regulator [Rhodobacter amnigenus]MBU9697909.1 response regulator [Rhodobacter amnigenus]MBV4389136.1 response regulator [Rhodobacter amnigenus]